jgi:hypothetical protein
MKDEDVPSNIRRAGAEVASMYKRLRSEGYTHLWAEMCALQQPPGTRGTDRAFMHGRYNQQWLDEMPKDQAQKILGEARAAGINVSGKFYMGGLADKRGHLDPAAWVEGAGDIKRVAKERNLTVSGIVDHKGEPQAPPKPKRLNARLTRRMMAEERAMNPGMKMKDGDLKEMVKEKYGYKRPKL